MSPYYKFFIEEKIDHFQIVSIFRYFFWTWGIGDVMNLASSLGQNHLSIVMAFGPSQFTMTSKTLPAPAQFNQSHPPQNPLYSDPIQFNSIPIEAENERARDRQASCGGEGLRHQAPLLLRHLLRR